MNHPPPSLLPSPTFVPPMVPSLYPVSLYPRAMGPVPPPPQGRSRGFAGQYLRIRCVSVSIYFIITHPVIIASYKISSFVYILSHLRSVLQCGLKSSLLKWRGVAWRRKPTDFPDYSPWKLLVPKVLTYEVTDVETKSHILLLRTAVHVNWVFMVAGQLTHSPQTGVHRNLHKEQWEVSKCLVSANNHSLICPFPL